MSNFLSFPTLIRLLFGLLLPQMLFAGSNNGLIYHGRIIAPNGSAVNSGNINFTVRIYGSSARYWDGLALQTGAERCLLFEETHAKDMTGTSGAFELNVGAGVGQNWGPGAISADQNLAKVFLNNPNHVGNYIDAISCSTGNTFFYPYGPDASAPEWVDRELVVSVAIGSESFTLSPMSIKAQPYALQAGQVGGFSSSSLFRIDGTSAQKFSVSQHDFLATSLLPGAGATMRIVGIPTTPVSANEATSKAYVDAQIATAISGGGGSVTSVTGVAPIQSSGGATPAISISQASGTIPGYLSAADWTIFNNKLGATSIFAGDVSGPYNSNVINAGVITTAKISDAAVTFAKLQNLSGPSLIGRGAAGAGVASEISVGTGLSLSLTGILTATNSGSVTNVTGVAPIESTGGATPALSISQASGTIPGYLSAADWTIFNNKLGAASVFAGDISGPYNVNFIVANAVTSSKISDQAVTFAKLQNMSGPGLIGRSTAGAGVASEISVGSGLSITAGVLRAASNNSQYELPNNLGVTGNWGRVALISVTQQFGGVSFVMDIATNGTYDLPPISARIFARYHIHEPLGPGAVKNGIIYLDSSSRNLTLNDVRMVITQHDGTASVAELWIRSNVQWDGILYRPQLTNVEGATVDFTPSALAAVLPAGDQLVPTAGYSPFSRTISGDATTPNDVGIGTTEPNALLQIALGSAGAAAPAETLRLTSTYDGIGSGPLLRFSNYTVLGGTNPSVGEYNLGGIQAFDDDDNWGGGLKFMTAEATAGGGNLTPRMTIRASGEIGIGTTEPTSMIDVVNHFGQAAIGIHADEPTTGRAVFYGSAGNPEKVGEMVVTPSEMLVGTNSTNGSIPLYLIANSEKVMAILPGKRVGINRDTASTALQVSGAIVSDASTIAAGGAVDLSHSNTFLLDNIGGATITLSNMVHGGTYSLLIRDTTARTYSFTGCNTSLFKPGIAATTGGTQSMFTIVTVAVGVNWHCYISWATGYQ